MIVDDLKSFRVRENRKRGFFSLRTILLINIVTLSSSIVIVFFILGLKSSYKIFLYNVNDLMENEILSIYIYYGTYFKENGRRRDDVVSANTIQLVI